MRSLLRCTSVQPLSQNLTIPYGDTSTLWRLCSHAFHSFRRVSSRGMNGFQSVAFRKEATSLYRQSLRALLQFPHPHLQQKLHANLREAYEVLRLPQKTFTPEECLQNGRQARDLLVTWSTLSPEHQKILFSALPQQKEDNHE